MTFLNRTVTLLVLLSAAIGCYFLGLISGVVVFLLAGVILELAFWLGIFRPRR